ncbi:MAG TPA: hypothetical protein VG737_07265 [Cyclobacteriaceae bacterium]|nr:hypothetical protein [Cyclobacteriaceae bacterium]
MTARNITATIAFILCLSCSTSQKNSTDERIVDFDHWVVDHLKKPLYLRGLDQRDSCNLSRLIATRMDSLVGTGDAIKIIWPYLIKRYEVGPMEMDYVIIANLENDVAQVYHLGIFRDWFISNHHYIRMDDSVSKVRFGLHLAGNWMRMKHPIELVEVDTAPIREVVDSLTQQPGRTMDYDKGRRLVQVIEAIFGLEGKGCSSQELLLYLESIPGNVSPQCLNEIKRLAHVPNGWSEIYELKYSGYIVVDMDSEIFPKIYLLPLYDRPMVFGNDYPYMFDDCDRLAR